jgi:protoheme IX farnesyltransferase
MNFKSYIELLKLRLSSSVVFSAIAGYLLAISEKTPHDPIILLKLILGGFFIVGSSNGLNQVFEIDVDGLMERTKNRPLPKKKLSLNSAILFSLFLGILGLLILFSINLYSGFFSLASLLIYVLGYTPMKVSTPIAGFVGAIPGAMPFMLGWVALQGNFGVEPGVFFAIQFVWQFPHFWSIAWIRFDDYKKANINLLPSKKKDNKSAFQIVFYTFCLIPLSLIPIALPYIYPETLLRLSYIGGFVVFLMSGWYFIKTLKFLKLQTEYEAKKIMIFSVIYLPTIQAIYIIDKYYYAF